MELYNFYQIPQLYQTQALYMVPDLGYFDQGVDLQSLTDYDRYYKNGQLHFAGERGRNIDEIKKFVLQKCSYSDSNSLNDKEYSDHECQEHRTDNRDACREIITKSFCLYYKKWAWDLDNSNSLNL